MDNKTFLVSDESQNSHGFKVLTAGIDVSKFEKNPIMLYMHERPDIIGRWENVRKEKGSLYADAVFDIENNRGKEVARQVENDFLRSASIGIIELERVEDVVTKSELVEISIVDMGSNSNALRLYKDEPEVIYLSFNEIQTQQSLIKILGLSTKTNQTDILNNVKELKNQKTKLSKELDSLKASIHEEREKEAEALTALAIKQGVIPENLKEIQKLAFKTDFVKAKTDLQASINLKMENDQRKQKLSIVDTFVKTAINNNTSDKSTINKENWTLSDYRKFAPKDLENNPELYSELIKKQYNK